MKIDLDRLEAIARAADKDNPGVCYIADHVDGYPSGKSAMDLFNAMDPATTLSLIRHIREQEEFMRGLVGDYAFLEPRITAVLAKGATLYGSMDPATDHWDIDRPADAPKVSR